MKKRDRFLVALLSAGISFSTFAFTVGTDHWDRYEWHEYHHGCYYHNDGEHEQEERERPGDCF